MPQPKPVDLQSLVARIIALEIESLDLKTASEAQASTIEGLNEELSGVQERLRDLENLSSEGYSVENYN